MSLHRLTTPGACFVLAGLYLALGACASAPRAETTSVDYPAIRLALGDIAPDAPDAPARLVQRIDQTVAAHCLQNGSLLTPAHRRGQANYCIDGVRAEIIRSLPPQLRAVYGRGRQPAGVEGAAP